MHGTGWTSVVQLPKKPQSSWGRAFSLSPQKKSSRETREDVFHGGIEFVVRESSVKVVHKALLEYGVGLRTAEQNSSRAATVSESAPSEEETFSSSSSSSSSAHQPRLDSEALYEVERVVSQGFQGSGWEEEIKKVRRESVIMTKKDTKKPEDGSESEDEFVDAEGGVTPVSLFFAKDQISEDGTDEVSSTTTNTSSQADSQEVTNKNKLGVIHVIFDLPGIMVQLFPPEKPSKKTLQNTLAISIDGVSVKGMYHSTQFQTTAAVMARVSGIEVREKGGNGALPCWVYFREPTTADTTDNSYFNDDRNALTLDLKVKPAHVAIDLKTAPLFLALDYDCCRRVYTFLVPSVRFGPTRSVLEDNSNKATRTASVDSSENEGTTKMRTFDANFTIGIITAILPTERYDITKPCFEFKLGVKPRHSDSGRDDGIRREEKIEITKLSLARGYATEVPRDGTYEIIEESFVLNNRWECIRWKGDAETLGAVVEVKTTVTEGERRESRSSGDGQFFKNFDRQHFYPGRKQDYFPMETGYDMDAGHATEASLWLDSSDINSPSNSPTSISITVLPLEIVCGWDELIGIAWTVGWCTGKKESDDDGRKSLSLSAMSVIRGENIKLMHIEVNAKAIGVRLVSSSNDSRRKGKKVYGPPPSSSEFATTNTFNLPVAPMTEILVLEAKDVSFKKQSATYASQMEVWVGTVKVGVVDQGYRERRSKSSKVSPEPLDKDCGIFWVVSITPPDATASAVNVSNPLLRIVRHPCGCHWSSLPTGSLGIGFYTTTVHVSAPFIKACVEPVMWGRIFHSIAAVEKAKALGGEIRSRVWGGKVIRKYLSGKISDTRKSGTKGSNSSPQLPRGREEPVMTLHLATGEVEVESWWGKELVDRVTFDGSTTCMEKFGAGGDNPSISLLGSVEGVRLRDETGIGRECYKDLITPTKEAEEAGDGVVLEWTFTGATGQRKEPPLFGVRVRGMKFIYLQRKTMENVFYWQKNFIPALKVMQGRAEDVLAGSVAAEIMEGKGETWTMGLVRKWREEKHPGFREKKNRENERRGVVGEEAAEAKIEILAVDSEIWLCHKSKGYDAIKIKFPTFKMWKAVESGDTYYSSPLLDQHRFAHEIPSMNRVARTRGKRVTSFSDLAEFGLRKPRDSHSSLSSKDFDVFLDVENTKADGKGELGRFLEEQLEALRAKERSSKGEAEKAEEEYAKEDSTLEQMKLDQDNAHFQDLHHPTEHVERARARHGSAASLQLPQFNSDETAALFISQMARVEVCDRKHSEALEKLSRVQAEIDALEEEIDWMMNSTSSSNFAFLPNPPDSRFDMELIDASLSTCLSSHPIQEHLTIKAWLALPMPEDVAGPAMYKNVYETLGYFWDDREDDIGVKKSPMNITVMLPRIYWSLTQAQYALILGLIMDNFTEDPTHVPQPGPDDPEPIFDESKVGPGVFNGFPVQIKVPVYFEAAEIVVKEDEPAYFENLDDAMAEDSFDKRNSFLASKSHLDDSNFDSTGSLTAAALKAANAKDTVEVPDIKRANQSPFNRLSDSESSGLDSDEEDYHFGDKGAARIKRGLSEGSDRGRGRNMNSWDEEDEGGESDWDDSDYSEIETSDEDEEREEEVFEADEEEKKASYPLFLVKAEGLYLGIDKNKDGQGVLLEVTSKTIAINDLSEEAHANDTGGQGSEMLRPNKALEMVRKRLETADRHFRGRLSTLKSYNSDDNDQNPCEDGKEEEERSESEADEESDSDSVLDAEQPDQLVYRQHNFGAAYRRIGVYVNSTVLSCYGDAIKRLIDFFYDPIVVHGQEEEEERERLGLPQEEEEQKNWDIDVQVGNTNVCLLEQLHNSTSRTLVLNADCAYFHRWRGYPNHGTKGPGSIDMVVELLVKSVFFANLSNLQPSDAISLASPFRLKLDIQTVLPCLTQHLLRGTPKEPVIKKTVLLWTEKADFDSKLSELDALHGDKLSQKPIFGTPSLAQSSGSMGSVDPLAALIDFGLSLPDIKLIGRVISTLMSDLKRGSMPAPDEDDLSDSQTPPSSPSPNSPDNRQSPHDSGYMTPHRKSSAGSLSGKSQRARVSSSSSLSKQQRTGSPANPKRKVSLASQSFDVQVTSGLHPQTNFAAIPTNLQILIGLSNARLAFVNNVMGIPLLSVRLTDGNVTLSKVSKHEGMRIYSKLTLQGSYFNHFSHRWDPLIETTTLEVDIGKDLNADRTRAKFDLKRPLHINLTHALLRLFAHDSLLNDHVTSSSKLLAPYTVMNRCGEKLTAIFSRSVGSPFEVPLKSGNDGLALDFRTITGVSRRSSLVEGLGKSSARNSKNSGIDTQGVQTHTMAISIVLNNWAFESINAIPMDVAGLHTIKLQAMGFGENQIFSSTGTPSIADTLRMQRSSSAGDRSRASSNPRKSPPPNPPILVAEVHLNPDGSKTITVRSRVCIQNHTGVPMEVKLFDKSSSSSSSIMRRFSLTGGNKSEQVKKLESSDVLYVPISMVKPTTSIWIRPNDRTDWAPMVDWLKDLEIQDNVIGMAGPRSNSTYDNSDLSQVSSHRWSLQMEVSKVMWQRENDRGVVEEEVTDEEKLWSSSNQDEDDYDQEEDEDMDDVEIKGKEKEEKSEGFFKFFGGSKDEDVKGEGALANSKAPLNTSASTTLIKATSPDPTEDHKPLLLFVRPTTNYGHKLASIQRKGDNLYLYMHTAEGGSSHRIVKKGQDAYDSLHDDFFSKIPSLRSINDAPAVAPVNASPLLNLTLLPPLVLHNLLCSPMLYRVSDRQGKIAAEGVIPIGTCLPLFRLDLRKKLYLSIRLVNYNWSTFSKLHTPRCVHPNIPKRYNLELKGGKLKKPMENDIGKFVEMEIPTLKLKTMVHGRHVRVFSRVWIINHTDLTLQYRESSAAAGIDAPSFLRGGMAQLTHKSVGALGNTSADVERYDTHTTRLVYGLGPDDYDDSKIEWDDKERRGRRKSIQSQTREAQDNRFFKFGSPDNNAKDNQAGSTNVVSTTSTYQPTSSTFPSLFSKQQRKGSNASDTSTTDQRNSDNNRLSVDDALGALDMDFAMDGGEPQRNPPFLRKRTMSVGGEDSASVLSDDSGFGSVDHRNELLDRQRTEKLRGSPTNMSDLSEMTSHDGHVSRDRVNSRDAWMKRKTILLNKDTTIELQKKLEMRLDRAVLEKRKILQKRRLVTGITVRLPTNHLHRVTLKEMQSDYTLHDLFDEACVLGGLCWTDDNKNTVGVREKDYFFVYHSNDVVWVPESEGGIGFMFGGYAPLPMSMHVGALKVLELRLCHRVELHIAWQQLDLNNTSSTNQRLLRYIDWGEAIMFSPPSTLGLRFHLCTRILDSEWSSPYDVTGQKDVISGLTSCLTLRQLRSKKRTRNIELAGGSSLGAKSGKVTPIVRREGSRHAPHQLEKLVEEVGFEEDEDEDEDEYSEGEEDDDADGGESEDDGEARDTEVTEALATDEWGTPYDTHGPQRRQRMKKQKQTSVFKPKQDSIKGKRDNRCQYDIGVHCASGKDVYFRTTIVTFLPRYILVNDLRVAIEVTQSGCEDDWRMNVPGGTSTGFHWPFKDRSFFMCARLQSDGFTSPSWSWSGEFSIDTLGETALKIRQKFRRNEIFLIRVMVKLIDASIVVIFEQVDEFVPYRIDNETSHRVRFRQSTLDENRSGYDYMMPRSSMPYSWDAPMNSKILEIEFQQGSKWVSRECRLDALAELSRIRLTRSLPDLSKPQFEGFLERVQDRLGGEKGVRSYCVLKGHTMYIFRAPNRENRNKGRMNSSKTDRLDLDGVINLGPGGNFLMGGIGVNVEEEGDSKSQIKQCVEKRKGGWGGKLGVEFQKMAELASATGFSGIETDGWDSKQKEELRKNEKREDERAFTIAVLLNRWMRVEMKKGGTEVEGMMDERRSVNSSFGSEDAIRLLGGGRSSYASSSTRRTSQLNSSRRVSRVEKNRMEDAKKSRFIMTGQEWINLILKLGICAKSRGNALEVAQTLFKRNFLRLETEGSSGVACLGLTTAAGKQGKRGSVLHTPRAGRQRQRLDTGSSRGSRGARVSMSPKRAGDEGFFGSEKGSDHGGSRKGGTSVIGGGDSVSNKGGGGNQIGNASVTGTRKRKSTIVADFFQDSSTISYALCAPNRDDDLDLKGSSCFEIVTKTGRVHKWRCKNPLDMKRWVNALRNAADNSTLSILFNPSDGADDEEEVDLAKKKGDRSQSQESLVSLLTATAPKGRVSGKAKSDDVTLDSLLAKTYVKVVVKADGPTKVLELSEEGGGGEEDEDRDEKDGADGLKMKTKFSQRTLTTSLSYRQGGEAKEEEGKSDSASHNIEDMSKVKLEAEVNVSLGVSVIDKPRAISCDRPRELIFLSLSEVKAMMRKSEISTEMALTVEGIQIDNQLHEALSPCILKTRKIGRKKMKKLGLDEDEGGDGEDKKVLGIPGLTNRPLDRPPALHFFANRNFVNAKRVLLWDIITLWLHPMDVNIEERLIFQALKLKDAVQVKEVNGTRVLALTNKRAGLAQDEMKHAAFAGSYYDTLGGGSGHLVKGRINEESSVGKAARRKKVFVNLLHLHPLDIRLSFKSGGHAEKGKGAVGVAVTAMGGLDDTQLKLGALQISNAFGSKEDLIDRIVKHYIFACMSQIGGVLGSAEFLGNPIGLISNIGTGFKDFFYEPLDGLTGGDGSKSFLEGLKSGTTSLGSHFGEGTFNTMSKMTGALGEGFANMSFDRDYKQQRSNARMREAKTISQGVRKGLFEFGGNLGEALGGIVMQPIKGAEREGGVGFIKGVGKGLVGLPVKTVVGILDLTSRATEGLKNEAKSMRSEKGGEGGDGRVRNPRGFGKEGELVEYDFEAARRQKALANVAKCKYAYEDARLDWEVRTFEAPKERKQTVWSTESEDLEKLVSESEKNTDSGATSGDTSALDEMDEEGKGTEISVLQRYLILTHKRLLYLGGSSDPPNRIWNVPFERIKKIRLEKNAIRLLLDKEVLFFGGMNEKRFDVLEESVPIVYDLKSQESLVFSIVCEQSLGTNLAMAQTLYPTNRFINVEGPMMRSKALLGSVTEKYYYAISGNVLYEYHIDKEGGGRKNDNLRMVIPLGDLTVMYNVGRDIVLKGPKGGNIPVATRSKKWGVGQALDNISYKFDRARYHMRAEEEHVRGSGREDDVGSKGSNKMPLHVSSREEFVLSAATGTGLDRAPGLDVWYERLTQSNVKKPEEVMAGEGGCVFIECNGLFTKEIATLGASITKELNNIQIDKQRTIVFER